jgi:hypothetical protein
MVEEHVSNQSTRGKQQARSRRTCAAGGSALGL